MKETLIPPHPPDRHEKQGKDTRHPFKSEKDGKKKGELLDRRLGNSLYDAKKVRDELRGIYAPHTDTYGLGILADNHIGRLYHPDTRAP
jgi:hypothetical protein